MKKRIAKAIVVLATVLICWPLVGFLSPENPYELWSPPFQGREMRMIGLPECRIEGTYRLTFVGLPTVHGGKHGLWEVSLSKRTLSRIGDTAEHSGGEFWNTGENAPVYRSHDKLGRAQVRWSTDWEHTVRYERAGRKDSFSIRGVKGPVRWSADDRFLACTRVISYKIWEREIIVIDPSTHQAIRIPVRANPGSIKWTKP